MERILREVENNLKPFVDLRQTRLRKRADLTPQAPVIDSPNLIDHHVGRPIQPRFALSEMDAQNFYFRFNFGREEANES